MKFSECIHSKETRKRDSVVKRESGRKRLFRQGFNTQDDNALLPGFEELSVKSVLFKYRSESKKCFKWNYKSSEKLARKYYNALK